MTHFHQTFTTDAPDCGDLTEETLLTNIANGVQVGKSAYALGKYYRLHEEYAKSDIYFKISTIKGPTSDLWIRAHKYRHIDYNIPEMKRCYKKIIDNAGADSGTAAYTLGNYYETIEKDIVSALQYYCIGAIKKDSTSHHMIIKIYRQNALGRYDFTEQHHELLSILAAYFRCDSKEYALMKKCYLKIIDDSENDIWISNAAYAFGNYYETIEPNIKLALKYYLIGHSKGDIPSLHAIKRLTSKK